MPGLHLLYQYMRGDSKKCMTGPVFRKTKACFLIQIETLFHNIIGQIEGGGCQHDIRKKA